LSKPDGKRPLGKTRLNLENNIGMDFQELEEGALRGLVWVRIGTVGGHWECCNEPPDFIKCGEFF
jgi:hypothetical protein